MGLKTLNKDIQKPIKPGPKKTLNFRGLSPPIRNPNAHEASPPRGHTLRHRHRPRFESTPGTNRRFTRIHRSSLTPHHHHRQPSSTEVSPNSESINRRIEISSVTIRRNHREEDFAGTVTVNLGPASIVLRRRHYQTKLTNLDNTKR